MISTTEGHVPSSPTNPCITAHINGTHVETQNPPALYTPAITNPIIAAPDTALKTLRTTNAKKTTRANVSRVRRTFSLGRGCLRPSSAFALRCNEDTDERGNAGGSCAASRCRLRLGFKGICSPPAPPAPPPPSSPSLPFLAQSNAENAARLRVGGNSTFKNAYIPTRVYSGTWKMSVQYSVNRNTSLTCVKYFPPGWTGPAPGCAEKSIRGS